MFVRASLCAPRLCVYASLSGYLYVCMRVCLSVCQCVSRAFERAYVCMCGRESESECVCVHCACMYICVLRWSITTVCSVSARLLLTLTYVTHCIVGCPGPCPFLTHSFLSSFFVSRFGLAVRRYGLVSGRTSVRYRFGSPFSSKRFVVCGHCLVTLFIISY